MSLSLSPAEITAIGGIAASAGAALAKALDWIVARRKSDSDSSNARFMAITEANRVLVEGMLKHINDLRAEIAEVRAELAKCEEHHRAADVDRARLRDEVAALRVSLTRH